MSIKDVIKKSFLEGFGTSEITWKMVVFVLGVAALLALYIFFVYRVMTRKTFYSKNFGIAMAGVTVITASLILTMQSSIVVSLGMVGALSIVRFRTAIKDSRDTIFIFWSIAEGLCVGSRNFKLALITTLFIAGLLMVTSFLPNIWNKYLLIVTGEEEIIDMADFMEKMKPFVLSSKLRAANKNDRRQEFIFELRTKGELDLSIVEALSAVPGARPPLWSP